jgi:hypothetical protein
MIEINLIIKIFLGIFLIFVILFSLPFWGIKFPFHDNIISPTIGLLLNLLTGIFVLAEIGQIIQSIKSKKIWEYFLAFVFALLLLYWWNYISSTYIIVW